MGDGIVLLGIHTAIKLVLPDDIFVVVLLAWSPQLQVGKAGLAARGDLRSANLPGQIDQIRGLTHLLFRVVRLSEGHRRFLWLLGRGRVPSAATGGVSLPCVCRLHCSRFWANQQSVLPSTAANYNGLSQVGQHCLTHLAAPSSNKGNRFDISNL